MPSNKARSLQTRYPALYCLHSPYSKSRPPQTRKSKGEKCEGDAYFAGWQSEVDPYQPHSCFRKPSSARYYWCRSSCRTRVGSPSQRAAFRRHRGISPSDRWLLSRPSAGSKHYDQCHPGGWTNTTLLPATSGAAKLHRQEGGGMLPNILLCANTCRLAGTIMSRVRSRNLKSSHSLLLHAPRLGPANIEVCYLYSSKVTVVCHLK
jgi:hypothetical protein